jgi:hypothetical protein
MFDAYIVIFFSLARVDPYDGKSGKGEKAAEREASCPDPGSRRGRGFAKIAPSVEINLSMVIGPNQIDNNGTL